MDDGSRQESDPLVTMVAEASRSRFSFQVAGAASQWTGIAKAPIASNFNIRFWPLADIYAAYENVRSWG